MKRTLKYALTTVLGAALVVPAMAQSNFPDVPETHWAYKELARMKADGLLVGYPDGLFRGGRPASRYEMAVALHALYMRLKGVTDGLKGQIDDILAKLETKADKADVDNLRAALDALKAQMGTVKAEDLAAVKRMVEEFGPELKALGADVAKMKKDIEDLDDRVSDLEKALPVAISGDVNFVILGGYGDNGPGVTVDNRPTGVAGDGDFEDVFRTATVFHEAAITLKNRTKGDVNWSGTLVFGNMTGFNAGAGQGFGGQMSNTLPGAPFAEGPTSFYIQNLGVDFKTAVLGLPLSAKVGRIGHQSNPLLFKRVDNTPFYSNSRWDNGDWTFDGAAIGLGVGGGINLKVFGGKTNTQTTSNGDNFQALMVGPTGTHPLNGGGFPYGNTANMNLVIDKFVGTGISTKIGSGSLNLAYLYLNSANNSAVYGRTVNAAQVYGIDLNVPLGAFDVKAGFGKSDYMRGSKVRVDDDNSAWYANLGVNLGENIRVNVGYKEVLPLYGAPGDWGRIGTWINPTDIAGFFGGVDFKLNENLGLNLAAGLYRGSDEPILGNGGFSDDDKINHYKLGLKYAVSETFGVNLGFERAEFDLDAPGVRTATQQWFNIGTDWSITNKAKLSFLWQISDVNHKNTGVPVFPGGAATKARGGLLTTQLSIKF